MNRKVLITGAKGMLATDLLKILAEKDRFQVLGLDRTQLDITDRGNVGEVFREFRPEFVIHTAAQTNVDYCEDHVEEALNVNGHGAENVAYYCGNMNAKMVYISSCGLFGDEIRHYSEDDEVVLKTQYSKSKYIGEQMVQQMSDKVFIVRPGWLFGGGKNHKKNFVYNRYLEALEKPEIKSASDKYGCPTYTRHLAEKILQLIETDCYGTYHVSNQGIATRFDYVKEIVRGFGLKTNVVSVSSSEFVRKAPVPDCELLKNGVLEQRGLGLLPDWREAIENYIFELKKEIF